MAHFIEVRVMAMGKQLVNADHIILVRERSESCGGGTILELDMVTLGNNKFVIYVEETIEEVKNKIINAKKKRIWHF